MLTVTVGRPPQFSHAGFPHPSWRGQPRSNLRLAGRKTMCNRPVRVLIIDDRTLSRSAMEKMLDRQEGIEVLGGAVDAKDAIARAERCAIDVVLINSLARTLDIAHTTKQVMTGCSDNAGRPRVLVLSHEIDEEALAAIEAGASGVVLTSISPEELVPVIRVANVGYLVVPPNCRSHPIIGRSDQGALNGKLAGTPGLDTLTDRENDILGLLAMGFSNSQISAELVLSESTVKSHVQHILNKLGLPNRVHAVIFAYELGLIQIGQNAPQLIQ
jgi:DNA-binding NarL/FixJ family response regulator